MAEAFYDIPPAPNSDSDITLDYQKKIRDVVNTLVERVKELAETVEAKNTEIESQREELAKIKRASQDVKDEPHQNPFKPIFFAELTGNTGAKYAWKEKYITANGPVDFAEGRVVDDSEDICAAHEVNGKTTVPVGTVVPIFQYENMGHIGYGFGPFVSEGVVSGIQIWMDPCDGCSTGGTLIKSYADLLWFKSNCTVGGVRFYPDPGDSDPSVVSAKIWTLNASGTTYSPGDGLQDGTTYGPTTKLVFSDNYTGASPTNGYVQFTVNDTVDVNHTDDGSNNESCGGRRVVVKGQFTPPSADGWLEYSSGSWKYIHIGPIDPGALSANIIDLEPTSPGTDVVWGDDTARTDTATVNPKGVSAWITTRIYDDESAGKTYGFARKFIWDKRGHLYSVSAETRYLAIDSEECPEA